MYEHMKRKHIKQDEFLICSNENLPHYGDVFKVVRRDTPFVYVSDRNNEELCFFTTSMKSATVWPEV